MTTLPRGTFYGAERARRRVGGLLLTETAYRAGDALPRHDHERAYFCCVLRGGFVERDGRASRECDPATVIFHPPGATHSDRFGGEPSRCFNVELDETWLGRVVHGEGALPAGSVVFRRERANWLARHLHDEFRADDPAGRLAVEGLAMALLADVARIDPDSTGPPPRWVDRAVEILHATATDDAPGLSEIAAAVDVHPVHLARVFRRHQGCSVGEYARRLRIERARETLRHSTDPIGRLAHRLGYADHSHFSRSFRRATGMSPSEYRRRAGSVGTDGASTDQDGPATGR